MPVTTGHTINRTGRLESTTAVIRECPHTTEDPCKPCLPDTLSIGSSIVQPKVLIIGAGIAGLSAAERLMQCGISNITILEALDRAGGRISTEDVGGTAMDTGATWILGSCPGNTMYTLASQEKVLKVPQERHFNTAGICAGSNGIPIKTTVEYAATKLLSEMLQEARKRIGKEPLDMNMWKFLSTQIDSVLKHFPHHDRAAASMALYGMTNDVRTTSGSELTELPVSKFGYIRHIPGGDVSVVGGMAKLIKPLLRAAKESNVKFKNMVRKIFWDSTETQGKRAIVVTCANESFSADYVILTLPLGVLKYLADDLFTPPLPKRKLEAIRRLEVGHMNTICLKYEKPFWIKSEGSIRTCWSADVILKGEHWTHSVGLIEEVPNAPDSLRMVVTGKAAQTVEKLSDCQVMNDATRMIRQFLGDPTLPHPRELVRSKWTSAPSFRGATTFLGKCGFESDLFELGVPLSPRGAVAPVLLFAGEATVSAHYSSLHGARLSGVREADRVLEFTKCFCGPPPQQDALCSL